MFIRKKKNRSGTISVVVVDHHGGKFKELHTVGIAHDEKELNLLYEQGREWINRHLGIMELDFDGPANRDMERKITESVLDNIDAVLLNGAKLILDKVYDSIGFNVIADRTLRQLVVARLCQWLRSSTLRDTSTRMWTSAGSTAILTGCTTPSRRPC